MAVSFIESAQVGRTANGGYNVAPENIIVRPNLSGRSEENDITELALDLEKRGQLIPATATKDDSGWPVLLAGHRRLRAIVQLNKLRPEDKKIKLLFNYVKVDSDESGLDYTISENRNRSEVNPLDDFFNIQCYMKMFGRSVEEVAEKYYPGANKDAERLKKAVVWVKDRLKLGELSDTAQEELRQGKLSTTASIQMSDLPRVEQDRLIKASHDKGSKKVKVADVQEARAAKKRTIDPEIAVERAIKKNATSERIGELEELCEMGALLVAEVLSEFRNETTLLDCSRELAALYAKAKISLPAELDKTYNR